MSRQLLQLVLALALVQGLVACDSSPSTAPLTPLGPSPVPPAAPQPPASTLRGSVSDTAFRPLAGVLLEIVEGPQAGISTTSDAGGQFSFAGTFDDTTRVRASKDGHVTATGSLSAVCATCNPSYQWIYFYLALLGPTANIAGEYTLTIVAADGCAAALPADVRSRTYAATIREAAPNPHNPPNTIFTTDLSGASFVDGYDTIPIGVAGDLVTFAFGGHGPGLVELLAPNTYLGLDGWVHAQLGPAAPPTISVAFEGVIDYCELRSGLGQFYECAPSNRVAYARCEAKNHQLILRPR